MTMATEEQIEQQFAAAVAYYIRRFNMLERNIGYSVRGMKRSAGEDAGAVESTFHGKLGQFKELIAERSLETVFANWLAGVERCRALRNNIVHGDWDLVPDLDQPIRFDTQQPGQPEAQREQGAFTMQEFRRQVARLEEVSDEFSGLQKTHGI